MSLPEISSLLREFFLEGLGQGGVTNILPVKPFETVMVIKGYTNKIELNYSKTEQTAGFSADCKVWATKRRKIKTDKDTRGLVIERNPVKRSVLGPPYQVRVKHSPKDENTTT